MPITLSCNLASYRSHTDVAYRHLPAIGVKHVEIPIPPEHEVVTVMNRLKLVGLSPASLMASADIGSEDFADQFAKHFPIAAKMGVKVIFTSIRADDVPKDLVYERLQMAGARADGYNITIALETHPDLMTNGDQALETLRAVDHRRIRMNFDTANIMYYNEGADTVDELNKVATYIASVHLKDTTGEYQTWNFPTLGMGVVDFKGVFQALELVGFEGPFTLELEGIEGQSLTADEAKEDVARSVDYLRKLNVLL